MQIASKDHLNREKVLCSAVKKGDQATIESLLRASNIDVNAIGDDGLTCLWHAVYKGDVHVTLILLEHKAEPTRICENVGLTALHLASLRGHSHIIQLLLTRKCCAIDDVTPDGMTALCLAAKHGHRECCELLLREGASPFVRVNVERIGILTPVEFAVRNNHEKLSELIASFLSEYDDIDVYADGSSIQTIADSVDQSRHTTKWNQSTVKSNVTPTYVSISSDAPLSARTPCDVPNDRNRNLDRKKKRRGCCNVNASAACHIS